jgi:hypothetical protein
MYPRSQILFPYTCIRQLRDLLDAQWRELVERVVDQEESSEEGLAFALMMIELCSCEICDQGSYKASLGCDVCSQRVVMGVKNDKVLTKRFDKALETIRRYLAEKQQLSAMVDTETEQEE